MLKETTKTRVVGVDLAYKQTTYAIVDVRGNIVAKDGFPTPNHANVNDFVAQLSEGIMTLAESTCGYENLRSVGVSAMNGNYMTGCIENAPNLDWDGQIPLAAMLRDRLGLAVALANDAQVRALGEYTYGCAHGMRDFILVLLGYGVGSCTFSNGRVHLGANGFSGEFGHTHLKPGGRPCACGQEGCVETYCSTKGVMLTAQELLAESNKPSLMRDCEHLNPRAITEFCNQGDELAIEVYRRTGEVLGMALANYASVINPEAIILTGGISKAGKWLLEPTNEAFEKYVFHNVRDKVKIMTSTLVDLERDLLGASALAWRVKEYSLFK